MVWILSTRGASTKLRDSPFTETAVAGVQSVVYQPGVTPVPLSGAGGSAEPRGTFAAGLHRISGIVFSHDGDVAETLLNITAAVDLIVRYRASGESRKRTLFDVLFAGDARVALPGLADGRGAIIGVPFRVQIPEGNTISDHVLDETDT